MKSAPRGDDTSLVEVSGITSHGIWLFLGDQEAFLPFTEFPWFREASVASVLHVERPQPHHLYWPELDIDLAVDSFLHLDRYPLISRERPVGVARRRAWARRASRPSASRRSRRR